MKPVALRFLTVVLPALAFIAPAHAQVKKVSGKIDVTGTMAQRQRASLAGIGPLAVTVGAFTPYLEGEGLHQIEVASDVFALLKRSGVPVSKKADIPPDPNVPRLTIKADVRKVGGPKSTGNAYTALLLVEVVQPVTIPRTGKPGHRMALPTWRLLDYTVLGRESLPTIRTRIGQAVGAFIADYKAANK